MQHQRFRLDIAYDGRSYDGWQSQPGGNTIQDILLDRLRRICPEITTVQGSGRTDAGVCAEGQVAHFDAPRGWSMDGEAWLRALNAHLPPTIRIMNARAASPDFHARFDARGKTYTYRICHGPVLPPLEYGLAWHRPRLDPEALLGALQIFVGTHHFRAFAANRNDGRDETRDTRRTILGISASFPAPQSVTFAIRGDGFLYRMVRLLIGTGFWMVEDRLSPEVVAGWLREPHPAGKAPFCAPAAGLSLKEVVYD